MTSEPLVFNGINGATGDYLLDSLTSEAIARVARGQPVDPAELKDIRIRRSLDQSQEAHFGLREGLDANDLAQAGWGVILPGSLEPKQRDQLKEALQPLLALRQKQAAGKVEHYYREFLGGDGYQPSESKQDFLRRFGRGAGPADPEKVPYYLLIVGDPEQIPFSFQYQLDVQYAVGRIYFDHLEDYYNYAQSVVNAESGKFSLPRQAAFWGTANQDDRATSLSSQYLVKPLADYMTSDQPDWKIQTYLQDQAYKSNLSQILTSAAAPALLFTASHGMAFPAGDPRQLPRQGALLCQDWPGPKGHRGPIPEDFYFSAEDVSQDANVFGSLAFFFACYGAGTPKVDNFYRTAFLDQKPIAPKSFLARLPQRLLSHPKGGALAVIGHVERAWGYSFYWDGVGQDLVMFESTLKRLADGHPLGSALEYFNERYAELSTDLTSELDETTPEMQDDVKIAGLWTSNNDARNYAILGDPAVRLLVGENEAPAAERPVIELFPVPTAGNTGVASPGPAGDVSNQPEVTTATDYGLGDTFRQAGTNLGSGIQQFVNKFAEFLSAALDDATSLEVATYVSENLSEVKYEDGHFTGARLRALTRIRIDGDTLLCVPEEDGEVDTALWKIHMDMMQQAQASRAELLKTVVSVASGLGTLLKP